MPTQESAINYIPENIINNETEQHVTACTNQNIFFMKNNIIEEQDSNYPVENHASNATISECKTMIEDKPICIFNENQVYSLSDYLDKIIIEVIESNRKEAKHIADKLKSCEKNGMLTPGILVDSMIAQKAGYTLKNVLRESEEDSKPRFCIMEGNNRFEAFLKALEKAKKDPNYTAFEYKFIYMRYDSPNDFKDAYRNINICNVPTKTKDFVRDFLATEENKILKSYNEKVGRKISAKGAGFGTVNQEISKRDINALFQNKASELLTDDSILEFTEPVYKAVLKAFGCESEEIKPILKGAAIWKFNAEKFNSCKLTSKEDKATICNKLVKFYENLTSATTSNIISAKKTSKKTKEQVIMDILDNEYKQKNKIKPETEQWSYGNI